MYFYFNNKNLFYAAIFISIIPAYIWNELYILLISNFNLQKFFNSVPLILFIKHNIKYSFSFSNYIYDIPIFSSNFSKYKFFEECNSSLKYYKYPAKISFDLPIIYVSRYELVKEAENVLRKALQLKALNRGIKARKLLAHALKLDPYNPNILAEYGEILEIHDTNIILAEFFCTKAILSEPTNAKAQECRRRTTPIVEELDQKRLNKIDAKVILFFKIPENHPRLKDTKKEQYFNYVYHTIAIEGNTLTLAQTRVILETRIAIGGKSLLEQNEVMGIDLALKYLNNLLNERNQDISIEHVLEIHKRVLGFVDISEAGQFRKKQVFIADHTPPTSEEIPQLMAHFITWLNSEEIKELHPIELAALAHWRFVFLHPFQDGNGRTARLLMNFILMRANYPPSIILTEDREQYFKLIKIANEGDVRPFIRFIANCTERTLDIYLGTKSTDSISVVENNQNLSILDLELD